MMNIWNCALAEQQRRRGNTLDLIVSVGSVLHDGRGFLCPGHYSIKEEPAVEDGPRDCHS